MTALIMFIVIMFITALMIPLGLFSSSFALLIAAMNLLLGVIVVSSLIYLRAHRYEDSLKICGVWLIYYIAMLPFIFSSFILFATTYEQWNI